MGCFEGSRGFPIHHQHRHLSWHQREDHLRQQLHHEPLRPHSLQHLPEQRPQTDLQARCHLQLVGSQQLGFQRLRLGLLELQLFALVGGFLGFPKVRVSIHKFNIKLPTTYRQEILNSTLRVVEGSAHRQVNLRPLKSHALHLRDL